jgi:hypothetical protein
MHTDPFGWLLPKNDRLLWVRGLPPPGSAQAMEPYFLAPHTQLTQTKSGRTSELIAHF